MFTSTAYAHDQTAVHMPTIAHRPVKHLQADGLFEHFAIPGERLHPNQKPLSGYSII
jgi:hypothetical protein